MPGPEYSLFAYATSKYGVTDRDINDRVYNNLSPGNQNQSNYNPMLDNTALKRACCNRPNKRSPKTVKVRIPTWPGAPYGNLSADDMAKENQYVDVNVDIAQSCPAGYEDMTKTNCKDFYRIYCGNILDEFIKRYWRDKNTPFPYDKWVDYKKECACFAPDPKWVQAMQFNTLPKCVIPECRQGSGAFLDSISQAGECQDLTYCSQNFSADTIAAIDNSEVNLAVTMVNNCGPGSDAQKSLEDTVQPGAAPQPVSVSNMPGSSPAPVPPSPPSTTITKPAKVRTSPVPVSKPSPASVSGPSRTMLLLPVGGIGLLCCCLLVIIIIVLFL